MLWMRHGRWQGGTAQISTCMLPIANRSIITRLIRGGSNRAMGSYASSQMNQAVLENDVLRGRFRIPAEEVAQLRREHRIDTDDKMNNFLMSLVQPASQMARPPISNFHVGAVGLGESGTIYVGVNIEFPASHLNQSIHAEQCLVLNCCLHGERGIEVLAVSEAPCGHCRQFYAELSTADTVRFVFGRRKPTTAAAATAAAAAQHSHHHASVLMHEPRVRLHEPRQTVVHTLDELLIDKFGPDDLAGDDPFPLLLQEQSNRVQLSAGAQQVVAERARSTGGEAFSKAAQEAARWANSKSYTNYTKSPSAVSVITMDGCTYTGAFIESAAFNPSLAPFQGAWAAAVMDKVSGFDQIKEVVIVELPGAKVQQAAGLAALLQTVAPQATLTRLDLQRL